MIERQAMMQSLEDERADLMRLYARGAIWAVVRIQEIDDALRDLAKNYGQI